MVDGNEISRFNGDGSEMTPAQKGQHYKTMAKFSDKVRRQQEKEAKEVLRILQANFGSEKPRHPNSRKKR